MSNPLYGSMRRRQAAQRMVPLGPCGCRDPLFCDCHPLLQPPLTEKLIDAGAQAARHLLELGYPPLLRRDTLAALHARGGNRQLVQQLYDLAGGDA